MDKICLIEAGYFLIGIDTETIISTRDVDRFLSDEQESNPSLFHLASCLSRQSLPVPAGDRVTVIEVKKEAEMVTTLLVDRVIGEIGIPSRFEELPLLYPKFAGKCCPQIFIHDEQVVLLLDVVALNLVLKKMQTAHGILSLDELCNKMLEAEDERGNKTVANESAATVKIKTHNTATTSSNETKSVQETAEIDEVTFSRIVSWTIDNYINCDKSESVVITTDMMPPGLIRQKGISDEIVQILINKTIMKSMKSTNKNLQLLKKSLADIK